MPTISDPHAVEPAPLPYDTAAAVVAAARDLARRYQLTPYWQLRLTPQAIRLVEAVLRHDAAGTCLSCGATPRQTCTDRCEFVAAAR